MRRRRRGRTPVRVARRAAAVPWPTAVDVCREALVEPALSTQLASCRCFLLPATPAWQQRDEGLAVVAYALLAARAARNDWGTEGRVATTRHEYAACGTSSRPALCESPRLTAAPPAARGSAVRPCGTSDRSHAATAARGLESTDRRRRLRRLSQG
eukprot:354169-Chlamydomonas_euryale.AAC.4